MPEKVRLDAAVLEKGFAESREKAKAYYGRAGLCQQPEGG